MEIVHWLHENRSEGCTSAALDEAASNGHLEMVQWLHAFRSEGCTLDAMDGAAGNGHFQLLKWLHENRSEGCSTCAIDLAGGIGRLDIIDWLRVECGGKCTKDGMEDAAAAGHFDVILYLNYHKDEVGFDGEIGSELSGFERNDISMVALAQGELEIFWWTDSYADPVYLLVETIILTSSIDWLFRHASLATCANQTTTSSYRSLITVRVGCALNSTQSSKRDHGSETV